MSSEKSSKKVPPGMVMGPDGKPCKVCTAFRHWRPDAGDFSKAKTASKATSNPSAAFAVLTGISGSAVASTSERPDTPPAHCPPDIEQLGRATWTFLHTTAAYYPDKPSVTQRAHMLSLLHSLPTLYPCSHCASHLKKEIDSYPPNVSNRVTLSRWLCERHNEVNGRLGKEKFDCGIESTDARWKDGPNDGSCD